MKFVVLDANTHARFYYRIPKRDEFYKNIYIIRILSKVIDHSGDPGVDWRIILRWICGKWDVRYGLAQAGSGYGQVAGTCDCGNEPSGFINCGEFLD
jgi:hypothetical protein